MIHRKASLDMKSGLLNISSSGAVNPRITFNMFLIITAELSNSQSDNHAKQDLKINLKHIFGFKWKYFKCFKTNLAISK